MTDPALPGAGEAPDLEWYRQRVAWLNQKIVTLTEEVARLTVAQKEQCVACANGDHQQCLGGPCPCIHPAASPGRDLRPAIEKAAVTLRKWGGPDSDGFMAAGLLAAESRSVAKELEALLHVKAEGSPHEQ